MNQLLCIALMFFGASCTQPEIAENQSPEELLLTAKLDTEEVQFYEVNLHQFAIKTELNQLEKAKKEYIKRVENGEEQTVSLLEQTMKRIELLNSYYRFNGDFKPRCVKKCPPPNGPNPCGDMSCPIRIPERLGIWVEKSLSDQIKVTAKDKKGNPLKVHLKITEIDDNKDFVKIIATIDGKEGFVEVAKSFKPAKNGIATYSFSFER
jgi:hypothetical protein